MKAEMFKKFISRKFIIAVLGVIVGAIITYTGNTTEGVTAIICSALGYLAAEGYIDAKAVKAVAQNVADSITKSDGTEGHTDA